MNADGTITDTNTRLVWEKQSADGTIHDQDNAYDWPEAAAVHIAGLNTAPCFANHCDWRLPNVRELQSIVNYQNSALPVSPAFNTGCLSGATVFTGSCTAGGGLWTSTSVADPELKRSDASVWTVEFAAYGGSVYRHSSDRSGYVRAVRGGL